MSIPVTPQSSTVIAYSQSDSSSSSTTSSSNSTNTSPQAAARVNELAMPGFRGLEQMPLRTQVKFYVGSAKVVKAYDCEDAQKNLGCAVQCIKEYLANPNREIAGGFFSHFCDQIVPSVRDLFQAMEEMGVIIDHETVMNLSKYKTSLVKSGMSQEKVQAALLEIAKWECRLGVKETARKTFEYIADQVRAVSSPKAKAEAALSLAKHLLDISVEQCSKYIALMLFIAKYYLYVEKQEQLRFLTSALELKLVLAKKQGHDVPLSFEPYTSMEAIGLAKEKICAHMDRSENGEVQKVTHAWYQFLSDEYAKGIESFSLYNLELMMGHFFYFVRFYIYLKDQESASEALHRAEKIRIYLTLRESEMDEILRKKFSMTSFFVRDCKIN